MNCRSIAVPAAPFMAVCFVLFCASAPQVRAQETATAPRLTAPKLFPAKTLAYLRIDNANQLKADLERSSMGKLGNDEQLKPILSEFYGSLVRGLDQMESAIGLNLDELLSIPSGELAIAVLPNDVGRAKVESRRRQDEDGSERRNVNVRLRSPAVALLLDAGDEISSVRVLLNRMDQEVSQRMVHEEKEVGSLTLHRYSDPDRQSRQFGYFIDDGVIIACSDADYVEKLANKWLGNMTEAETLANNRKFTAIMSRCVGAEGERPQMSFYADPLALIRQFAPKNAATSATLAMLPVMGVDGIEAVGGSWIIGPPDFDSISHMHMLLGTPRRGILSLVKPKSGSTEPESWVPDNVASYSTINWDLNSTLLGIERLFNQFRGEDALQKQVFDQASERFDIDIRKDVLENLEGRITLIAGFVRPVTINSGSNVYAAKAVDIDKFKTKVLPQVIKLIEERTEVKLESFGKLRVHVIRAGGRNVPDNAPIRVPEICITTLDDYVLIADSRYMLRQVAECYGGNIGSLGQSLEYQLIADRISAQLQDKECSAIQFARPEESLQLFYELARDPANKDRLKGIAEGNPFFTALYNALDKHELPPFSVISKYLAPGGGFLVDEETGLHYMSFGLRRE